MPRTDTAGSWDQARGSNVLSAAGCTELSGRLHSPASWLRDHKPGHSQGSEWYQPVGTLEEMLEVRAPQVAALLTRTIFARDATLVPVAGTGLSADDRLRFTVATQPRESLHPACARSNPDSRWPHSLSSVAPRCIAQPQPDGPGLCSFKIIPASGVCEGTNETRGSVSGGTGRPPASATSGGELLLVPFTLDTTAIGPAQVCFRHFFSCEYAAAGPVMVAAPVVTALGSARQVLLLFLLLTCQSFPSFPALHPFFRTCWKTPRVCLVRPFGCCRCVLSLGMSVV